MNLIVINWGGVRSFSTAFTKAVDNLEVNPKCRSFRVRNVGDENATITIDNIIEPFNVGDSLTFGGYNYSFRKDVISFEFSGGGTNPKIIISQDVQQDTPVFSKEDGTVKKC